MKSANKSVATRTVFTTQIWDITEITQPWLTTAEKQLRAWGNVDKKNVAVPLDGRRIAQSIGSLLQKETQQQPETAEKQLITGASCWKEKYKVGIHPGQPKAAQNTGVVPLPWKGNQGFIRIIYQVHSYLYRAHYCRQSYKTVTKVNDITLSGVMKLALISTVKICCPNVALLHSLSVLALY
jgi:hypothetical protein